MNTANADTRARFHIKHWKSIYYIDWFRQNHEQTQTLNVAGITPNPLKLSSLTNALAIFSIFYTVFSSSLLLHFK